LSFRQTRNSFGIFFQGEPTFSLSVSSPTLLQVIRGMSRAASDTAAVGGADVPKGDDTVAEVSTPGACTWPTCTLQGVPRQKCSMCNNDERTHESFCAVTYMGIEAFDKIERWLKEEFNRPIFVEDWCYSCFLVSCVLWSCTNRSISRLFAYNASSWLCA